MTRDELRLMARQPDLPTALQTYFQTPAGLAALRVAPTIQTDAGVRPMSAAEAVTALLEEAKTL